jgi:hypothetical protein
MAAPLRLRPALAVSLDRAEEAVRWLKLSAGGLAVAAAALAMMNHQGSQPAATAFEPPRNETVIYRQGTPQKSYARAIAADGPDHAMNHSVRSNYPRAVQTVRFVNTAPQAGDEAAAAQEPQPVSLASRVVFEPETMTRVAAFVAFSGNPGRAEAVTGEAAESAPAVRSVRPGFPRRRTSPMMEEVDQYLWEVYQREPTKKDRSGDFTWKDQAAAKRASMSLQDYVIGGMDPDFREQLYHAGRAMDAAGIRWFILSGFRDDYRQRIAAGFKARTGRSLHGGSRATGGYGHGRAVDIMGVDGTASEVWEWLDDNGAKYGLRRPIPGPDPAHVQPRGDWRKIATALRQSRMRVAEAAGRSKQASSAAKVAAN